MDDIRIKQAEHLIKIAAKAPKKNDDLKEAKAGIINVELYDKVLKDLINAEDFIISSLPSHYLSAQEARIFTGKLVDAREKIQIILTDFGVMEKKSLKHQIFQLSKSWLILTTKSSFKKMLVNMGVNAPNVVVAGVPLTREDMKKLNPQLPKTALKSINKKIQRIKNDISKKTDKMNLKNILVLAEDDLNGNILGKRSIELYNAQVVLKNNLKDLKDSELLEILGEAKN